jgi:hypothetical protein
MRRPEAEIRRISVAACQIPTDPPESDGTLERVRAARAKLCDAF